MATAVEEQAHARKLKELGEGLLMVAERPAVTGGQLLEIALGEIHETRLNPRKHFDAKKLAELGASLERGQINPVLVRPRAEGGYELAAGHRRRRAAELKGLPSLLAIVKPMDDAEFMEVLAIENLQREGVEPLDEAIGYQQLLTLPGYTVEGIAVKIGKSPGYVYSRLKLAELTPEARDQVWMGKLPLTHAILIARLPADDQARALKQVNRWDGVPRPYKEFLDSVRSDFHVALKGAVFDRADAALLPEAGACLTCPKRTGTNPGLFEELEGKEDLCTDRGCYDRKVSAHTRREVARAKDAGQELVQISTRWQNRPSAPGKPLNQSQWESARKGEKGAVRAIMVNGEKAGAVTFVKVKPPPRAGKAQAAPKRDTYAEQEERRRAKARAEQPARSAVVQAVLVKVTSPPSDKVLRLVAHELLFNGSVPDELMESVLGAPLGNRGDFKRKLDAILEKLSGAELLRAVVAGVIGDEAEVSAWNTEKPETLLALAKLYKVDVERVSGAARAKVAEEKAAAAKEQRAKAKTKAAPKEPAAAAAPKAKTTLGARARRRAATPFNQLQTPSAALAAIVGEGAQTRTEITKKLWTYIKKHDLQDAKVRRTINADELLQAVVGKPSISLFDMTKAISKHLTPAGDQ